MSESTSRSFNTYGGADILLMSFILTPLCIYYANHSEHDASWKSVGAQLFDWCLLPGQYAATRSSFTNLNVLARVSKLVLYNPTVLLRTSISRLRFRPFTTIAAFRGSSSCTLSTTFSATPGGIIFLGFCRRYFIISKSSFSHPVSVNACSFLTMTVNLMLRTSSAAPSCSIQASRDFVSVTAVSFSASSRT